MPNHGDLEESRYRYLLSTNDEPHDLEIPEIQSMVEQKKSCLTRLAARIKETQATLDSLIEWQEFEQRSLSRFNAILSPIRRLSLDILLEIFLFTLDWMGHPTVPEHSGFGIVGPGPVRSSLIISHVCSEWRRVALSAPVLWATIDFRLEKDGELRIQDPARDEGFQTLLGRAGNVHPLDLTLIAGTQRDHRRGVTLAWVRPYAHRIKRLSLEGIFSALPNCPFDVLEELNLSKITLINRLIPSTPSIRYLAYEGSMMGLLEFHSWQRLTRLRLEMCVSDRSKLIGVLSQCTALVEFTAGFYIRGGGLVGLSQSVPDSKRIVMPRLETLDMEHYPNATWLLSYLTLPALTKITISYDWWPAADYKAFQSRSLFPLKSITLCGPPQEQYRIRAAHFLDLLRRTPSITEIKSYESLVVTPGLIEGLTASSPNGVLEFGPNLEYLEMRTVYPRGSRPNVKDADMILDMLASRNPSSKPAVFHTGHPLEIQAFVSHVPKRPYHGIRRRMAKPAEVRSIHIYF